MLFRSPNAPQTYKTIGVFSTAEKAREMQRRYSNVRGFRNPPERWQIWETPVDQETDWREGYDTTTHEPLLKGARPERL